MKNNASTLSNSEEELNHPSWYFPFSLFLPKTSCLLLCPTLHCGLRVELCQWGLLRQRPSDSPPSHLLSRLVNLFWFFSTLKSFFYTYTVRRYRNSKCNFTIRRTILFGTFWGKDLSQWKLSSDELWNEGACDVTYLVQIYFSILMLNAHTTILLDTDLRRIVDNWIWRTCRSLWMAENESCRTHTKSCRAMTSDRRLFHVLALNFVW